MEDKIGNIPQDTLFIFLVEQFRIQAWISLGKIKNPVTDKIEQNLEMAKQAIDMLRMLQSKTSGNLSGEEERLVKSALADLQLNYVDEVQKAQKKAADKPAAANDEKAAGESGEPDTAEKSKDGSGDAAK